MAEVGYDHDDHAWNPIDEDETVSDSTTSEDSSSEDSSSDDSSSSDSTVPASNDDGTVNSVAKAKKTHKEIEFRNLVGTLNLRPCTKSMSVTLASTLRIMGLGKFLSGHYFVSKRKLTLSSDGAMAIELEVRKTKFGENMKAYVDSDNADGVKVTEETT